MRILHTAAARQGTGELVFRSEGGKHPPDRNAMRLAFQRCGIGGTRHGLRSAFRTWCDEVATVRYEAAELCLSHHVGSQTARAYLRTDLLEERRVVMQAWADYLNPEDGAEDPPHPGRPSSRQHMQARPSGCL